MSDIFISYSSKDKEKADQLSELLSSAGLSVWIDQSNIGFATSWSSEIVKAINDCKAFVVLLSPSSVESHNVIKEVSLASEKRKNILPLDLEPVQLTKDFEYQLAGIQRAPMTNIDAVIRALAALGLGATAAPVLKIVREIDGRKSLMILPLEDLSPTQDNGWFTDGIASEMVSTLSNIKSLRLIDWNTSRMLKNRSVKTVELAREFEVRYFIEGQVRKFGDQIKISITLLDIETGDHLWQDSLKGTMEDIFDIQEKVAQKVVEALKIHLPSDEKKGLLERGTENVEAYELRLKATEYLSRQTKQGTQLGIQLAAEAIKLDPTYADAYSLEAALRIHLYREYDRSLTLLIEAESLCKEALRLKPDHVETYFPLSQIYMMRGQVDEAVELAKEYVRKAPDNYQSHFTLGSVYRMSSQFAKAIPPSEQAVLLKPDRLACLWNLVIVCDAAREHDKCRHWAQVALPHYERHVKLQPEDEGKRVCYAALLEMSGRRDDSHAAAMQLKHLKDGISLYNTANLFGKLDDNIESLRTFRKAIEAGWKNIPLMKEFLMAAGAASLAGTAEYEDAKSMVERIEREIISNV